MPTGSLAVTPGREYALSLHNKHAHEHDACLLVFDPDEVAAAVASGTYCVSVALTPAPGRHTMHLALGYFRKVHHAKGNPAFFASATDRLKRLRGIQWQADVMGAYDWPTYQATVTRLMKHRLVREKLAALVKALEEKRRKLETALSAPGLSPVNRAKLERQFPILADEATRLIERMYPVAIEDLVGSR